MKTIIGFELPHWEVCSSLKDSLYKEYCLQVVRIDREWIWLDSQLELNLQRQIKAGILENLN